MDEFGCFWWYFAGLRAGGSGVGARVSRVQNFAFLRLSFDSFDTCATHAQFFSLLHARRTVYEQLQVRGRHTRCFQSQLEFIEHGKECAALTEVTRRELAGRLLACHLQSSGRNVPSCLASLQAEEQSADAAGHDSFRGGASGRENALRSCTASLDAHEFGLFTAFFVDVEHLCFFVTSSVWLARIEESAHELRAATREAAEQLQTVISLNNDVKLAMQHANELAGNPLVTLSSMCFLVLVLTLPQSTRLARAPLLLVLFARALSETFPTFLSTRLPAPVLFVLQLPPALTTTVALCAALLLHIVLGSVFPRGGKLSSSQSHRDQKDELVALLLNHLRENQNDQRDGRWKDLSNLQSHMQSGFLSQFDKQGQIDAGQI